jgi:hypothetical protein
VVVDLTVHCHHNGLVLIEQGLIARGGVDDGKALVCKEVVAELVHTRPAYGKTHSSQGLTPIMHPDVLSQAAIYVSDPVECEQCFQGIDRSS